MERKRKLPARAARVESANKKRTSTPPEQRLQAPAPTLPPPQPVQESLPQSIAPGKPLPTVDTPQPENLSDETFQSVAERLAIYLSPAVQLTPPTSAIHSSMILLHKLTFLAQWCFIRISTSVPAEMAERGYLREILDETNEEKGSSRSSSQQPAERFDDENWTCYDFRRSAYL